ncbi:hypothetical protein RR48_14586 [Papilio machaon]|uniref:Uncharacterized protein n=1 Tax=Papilio machaon TaxID=76193 RepID=A0A194QL89_PAPMA|nr:hypothetical protein RR48_14586 [Papilio machaon]
MWSEEAGPSRSPAERRPLVLGLRVPRSYGSVFPYYKFVKDTFREPALCESDRSGGGRRPYAESNRAWPPRNMLPPERAALRSASTVLKRLSLRTYSTYSLVRMRRLHSSRPPRAARPAARPLDASCFPSRAYSPSTTLTNLSRDALRSARAV